MTVKNILTSEIVFLVSNLHINTFFTRDLPQEGPKKGGDHRTDAENNEEENYEEDEEETEGDAAGRDKRTNQRAEM